MIYHSAMSRKGTGASDILNLVTIDVNTILNFFVSFHECWSLILKLIIGLILLYLQMKEAVLIGFITAVLLVMMNFKVA